MNERKNAGYIITESIHIRNTEFVLGEQETKYGTQYVTWEYFNGSYFWGHYHEDKYLALKDLLKRAKDELERNRL